jgi:hypothetical protein
MTLGQIFTLISLFCIIGCSTVDNKALNDKNKEQEFTCYSEICFVNEFSFLNYNDKKGVVYTFNLMNGDEGFGFIDCKAKTFSTFDDNCEENEFGDPECKFTFIDNNAPGAKYCNYLFN